VLWARTRQLQANATSLVAIVPISIAGVVVYYFGGRQHHEADLRLAALMTVGAVVGAYAGARAAGRIPERALKVLVALLLLATGIKLLLPA
jgi:uncharacterized membrane protein YfcA